MILPILGGYFLDTFGTSGLLLFALSSAFFGQFIFSVGIEARKYWIMLTGRTIFGFGGELTEVIQTTITSIWFADWYLSLALALNLTIARIGAAVNDILSPLFENAYNVAFASWFGLGMVVISFICGLFLIYFIMEYKPPGSESLIIDDSTTSYSIDEISTSKPKALSVFQHLTDFPLAFWILNLICVCYYGVVVPFVHISSDFLQAKYPYLDARSAGQLISIPDWISAFGSPICALGLDFWIMRRKKGKRAISYEAIISDDKQEIEIREVSAHEKRIEGLDVDAGRFLLPIAGLIVAFAHFLFITTNLPPALMLVMLGFSYSCFGAILWPMVSYLVPKNQLGTAYGILTISLNASLSIFPIIVAKLRIIATNFSLALWFFAGMSLTGMTLSIVLCVVCHRMLKHLGRLRI